MKEKDIVYIGHHLHTVHTINSSDKRNAHIFYAHIRIHLSMENNMHFSIAMIIFVLLERLTLIVFFCLFAGILFLYLPSSGSGCSHAEE